MVAHKSVREVTANNLRKGEGREPVSFLWGNASQTQRGRCHEAIAGLVQRQLVE